MQQVNGMRNVIARKAGTVALAALIALVLSAGSLASPARAEASTLEAGAASAPGAQAPSAPLAMQASDAKVALDDAKKIVKKAKATSGTAAAKLRKIYTHIAKDKQYKGVYQIESLPFFKIKYGGKYYSYLPREVVQKSLLKNNYKKYAVDMFNDKKGTCFHYAALFAVAAKQALGSSATVKIAAGASKHTGQKVDYHSWVEVKLGSKTYVYDPQAGNTTSKSAKKATSFGKFCGTEKGKLKANYYNYKGVQYIAVKL